MFDNAQCLPVPEKEGAHVGFGSRGEETFVQSCHFVKRELVTYWITLTENHRAKDCPQMGNAIHLAATNNRVEIDKTIGVAGLGATKPSVICWSNKTRKRINDMFATANNLGESLPPFQTDKRSNKKLQDYTFQVGMPLVCIRTDVRRGGDLQPRWCNDDWGIITKFAEKVTVKIEEEEHEFVLKDFFSTFVPGFAITVYAAQGSTFDWGPFAVADYGAMPWRLRYTAISRAKTWSQVHEFY